MQIYTTRKIGAFHPVYCEDFLFETTLGSSFFVAAVIDGSTMGKDSHFASALIGKVLQQVTQEIYYQEFTGEFPKLDTIGPSILGAEIIRRMRSQFRKISRQLMLDLTEQLATVVLAVIQLEKRDVWVIALGDGYIACDGKLIEIEQGNKPDYFAYRLSEEFEGWFADQRLYEFFSVQDFSIATDGVGCFEQLDKGKPPFPATVEDYLLVDEAFLELPKMLDKKIAFLEAEHGVFPADDVAVLRVRWEREMGE